MPATKKKKPAPKTADKKAEMTRAIVQRREWIKKNRAQERRDWLERELTAYIATARRAFKLGFIGSETVSSHERSMRNHEKDYRTVERMEQFELSRYLEKQKRSRSTRNGTDKAKLPARTPRARKAAKKGAHA